MQSARLAKVLEFCELKPSAMGTMPIIHIRGRDRDSSGNEGIPKEHIENIYKQTTAVQFWQVKGVVCQNRDEHMLFLTAFKYWHSVTILNLIPFLRHEKMR